MSAHRPVSASAGDSLAAGDAVAAITRALAAAAAVLCAGCQDPPVERACVPPASAGSVTVSPIVGGSASAGAADIGLSPAQELAVGAVENAAGEVGCSGTIVAAGWVLTARHCEGPEALWFRTGWAGRELRLRESRRFVHPSRDVMLIRLQPSAELDPSIQEPIPIVEAPIGEDWIGREVTLAGLGVTETGARGERRFVKEPIVGVTADLLIVDGQGASGACVGDSGGPLLGTEPGQQRPRLLGVLSGGASSCVGLDRYERADSLASWMTAALAEAAADPCGSLTWEGECRHGSPIWCAGSFVAGETCAGKRVCGWSAEVRGYRCVEVDLDPCRGAGSGAHCEDDQLVRCDSGQLVVVDCRSCGARCGTDAEENARCQ